MVDRSSKADTAGFEECKRRKVVEAVRRASGGRTANLSRGVGKSRRRGDGGSRRAVGAGLAVLALMCLSGWAEFAEGGGGGGADLNIPRRVRADDPTLQRAVDAYRQVITVKGCSAGGRLCSEP